MLTVPGSELLIRSLAHSRRGDGLNSLFPRQLVLGGGDVVTGLDSSSMDTDSMAADMSECGLELLVEGCNRRKLRFQII